jgi:hypothetical protein
MTRIEAGQRVRVRRGRNDGTVLSLGSGASGDLALVRWERKNGTVDSWVYVSRLVVVSEVA